MSSRNVLTLQHQASRGGGGRWETQGAVERLTVSQRLIDDIQKLLDVPDQEKVDRGGVKLRNAQANAGTEIELALDWDLKFAGALEGQAHVRRLSGDIMVPAEPAFPLGLETMDLDVAFTPTAAPTSRIQADLQLATNMGRLSAAATTLLHSPEGNFSIHPHDTKVANLDPLIVSLGWHHLILPDT